jgi:hypothetical protein
MAIASVGTPSGVIATSGAITGVWGTGQTRTSGNLLVAAVASNATTSAAAIANVGGTWTKYGQEASQGHNRVAYFYKIATGTDAAPAFTSTLSGTYQSMYCVLYVLSGTDNTGLIATYGTITGTTANPLTVTTVGNVPLTGCYALSCHNLYTGTSATDAWTKDANWTNNVNTGGATARYHYAADFRASPPSGSTLACGGSWASAGSYEAAMSIVIKPTINAAITPSLASPTTTIPAAQIIVSSPVDAFATLPTTIINTPTVTTPLNASVSPAEVDTTTLFTWKYVTVSPHQFYALRIDGGGNCNVFDISPTGVIIAGSDTQGLYRTTNLGDRWEVVNAGVGVVPPCISAVLWSITEENTVYAFAGDPGPGNNGTPGGMLVSTDGGRFWSLRSTNPQFAGNHRADPLPDLDYARSAGRLAAQDSSYLFAATYAQGVLRSADNGFDNFPTTCTMAGSAPGANYSCTSLEQDPADSSTLYVAMYDYTGDGTYGHVWKTTNGHATTPNFVKLTNSPAIVEDLRMVGTYLYAACGTAGLYRSTDGGTTWTSLNGSFVDIAHSNYWKSIEGYVNASGSHVIYAGDSNNTTHAACLVSLTIPSTWPGSGSISYANLTGSVYHDSIPPEDRSWWHNASGEWQNWLGTGGYARPFLLVDASNLNAVNWYCSGATGFYRNIAGTGWAIAINGMPMFVGRAVATDPNPLYPGHMVFSTSDWASFDVTDGVGYDAATVTRSAPINQEGFAVAFDPVDSTVYLSMGTKYTNALGTIWSRPGNTPLTWVTTDFETHAGGNVAYGLCGLRDGSNVQTLLAATWNGGIWRGQYNGSSWTWTQVSTACYDHTAGAGQTSSFGYVPGSPYVYCFDRQNGVYRSNDYGVTWVQVWSGTDTDIYAGEMVADPNTPGTIWFTTHNGLYKITNAHTGVVGAGATLTGPLSRLPGSAVAGVVGMTPNSTLVLTTQDRGSGSGIWTSVDGGTNWYDAAADDSFAAANAWPRRMAVASDGRVYVLSVNVVTQGYPLIGITAPPNVVSASTTIATPVITGIGNFTGTWQGTNFGLSLPVNSTIDSVSISVRHHESDITNIDSVTGQIYISGTPVGSPVSFTRSLTDRTDIVTVTSGIAVADIPNLAIRVVSHSIAPNTIEYVDQAYASVSYEPPPGAFVRPDVVSVPVTIPLVVVNTSPFEFASGGVGSGSTSRIIYVSAATRAGDTLLVVADINSSTVYPTACTDSAGNVYTQDVEYHTNSPSISFFRSPGATGGPGGGQTVALTTSSTVTITTSGNTQNMAAVGIAVPGAGAVDQIPTINHQTTVTTSTCSATPAYDNEICVAGFSVQSSATTVPVTQAPFNDTTGIRCATSQYCDMGWRILGSGTAGVSQSANATWTTGANSNAGMWTFQSGVNVAITPTIVSASTVITAPTVTLSASVVPSLVSTSAVTINAPTITRTALATPSLVSATTSIVAPSVSAAGNVSVTPTVVSLSTTIGSPTVSNSLTVTASAVSTSITITAPFVARDIVWQGTNFGLTAPAGSTINSVSVSIRHHESSVTDISAVDCRVYSGGSPVGSSASFTKSLTDRTDTISVTTGLGSSDIPSIAVRVTAHCLTSAATQYVDWADATVTYTQSTGNSVADPFVVAATVSIPAPSIKAMSVVSPSVVSGSTTIGAPSFNSRTSISAGIVNSAVTIAQPTASAVSSVVITPAVITVTLDIASSNLTDAFGIPAILLSSVTIGTPTVSVPITGVNINAYVGTGGSTGIAGSWTSLANAAGSGAGTYASGVVA